jgi:hypothetical protein
MSKKSEELDLKILKIIQKGVGHTFADSAFNEIALELFEFQYARNLPYQRYCKTLRATPDNINHWKHIPYIPTGVFKEAQLACFPLKKAKKIFYTSGTSRAKQGRHYLENLTLYETSLLVHFNAHFLINKKRWPLFILTPSPEEMPHSSLCHMMGVLQKTIGIESEPYFIKHGKFLIDSLKKSLAKMSASGQPLILLGTAFSFVHFLEDVTQMNWKTKLPPDTKVMETGGYKGKSREMSKPELYHLIQKTLGVPKTHIINEYGMTEMGSQFYDNTLKNTIQGVKKPSFKDIPPWVRTRVLNPLTLEESAPGQIGLLQHYDLANRSNVMALLTEDLGVKIGNGFEILGRAPESEPRGCSLGLEEWFNNFTQQKL